MVVWDTMDMLGSVTMAMLDILVMAMASMVLAMLTTMESVRLRQSPRLRLTQPCFTAPMAMVLVLWLCWSGISWLCWSWPLWICWTWSLRICWSRTSWILCLLWQAFSIISDNHSCSFKNLHPVNNIFQCFSVILCRESRESREFVLLR